MAFMSNPATGEGGFTTYVKYNAKAGRWYTKKDEKDAPEFEVTNMTAIFDLENIRTGWFMFATGVAPSKTFDPSLAEAAPKPGDGFKRGFELNAYSEANLLGLRDFSSTAGVVIEAMNALHTDWEVAKAQNPGKLPVVKCAGVLPIVGSHGINYQPQLEIVAWADRPAEMASSAASTAAPAANAPPPAAKPTHAPPPAAKVPEPVGADDAVVF